MKYKSTKFTAVLFGMGFALTQLQAQTTVVAGDLVLFFQKPGDTDTVYVNLGSAATLYRGAESGPSAAKQALDIVNIDSTLTSAFGAGWATDPDIYAGLAGAFSNSTAGTVVDGDQYRTLYVSKPRTSVGTVGSASSTQWNLVSAGNLTLGATNMTGLTTNFATQLPNLAQGKVTTEFSSIDNQNPTSLSGSQSTAFGQFVNGVQQRGSASVFGTFGPAGQVEFALDLQRLVPDSTVSAGEIEGTSRTGSYEGTITVGTSGNVSFITQGAASSAYDTWIATFPTITIPADKLETADPDGDGATNLEEFGFGGNPASGSDSGIGQVQTVDANSDTLKDITLTLEVRSGATFSPSGNDLVSAPVDELTYRIEGSTDLVNWDSAVSEVAPLGSGSPSTGYVFKTFRLNAGNGLAGKGFLRAVVTK